MIEEHIIDKNLAKDIFNYYINKATIIVQTDDLHHFYATGYYNNPLLTLIVTIEILLDCIIQNSISYIYIINIHSSLPLKM